MKFLLFLALAGGGIAAAVPWINASLDESGLRQDAAMSAENSRSSTAVKASAIAHAMLRYAKERGVPLTEQGLHIEVEAARKGVLGSQTVAIIGQDASAALPTASVQKATIQVQYDQPIYLGLTKHVEFTVESQAIGDGEASTWPALEKELDTVDRQAPPY